MADFSGDREKRLQEAIQAVQEGSGVNKAVKSHDIPPSTLKNRLHGAQERHQAHQTEQKLSVDQEEFLVSWILNEESTSRAPSRVLVTKFAKRILSAGGDPQSLSHTWIDGFLARHKAIHMKNREILKAARAKSTTAEKLQNFYDCLKHQVTSKRINPSNMANADEHEIAAGHSVKGRVLGTSLTRRVYVAHADTREWSTILECITPEGHRYTPLIIFKGQSLQGQYFPNQIRNWKYNYSDNGWITAKIFLKWFKQVYLPESKPQNPREWRLLILDGHNTHKTDESMFEAWINKVWLIYLPAHSSHITQPLDLSLFSPCKTYYSQETNYFDTFDYQAPIHKAQFLEAYYKASDKAFTVRNLVARFRATGIWPINPSKALDNVGVVQVKREEDKPPPDYSISRGYDVFRLVHDLEGINLKDSAVRDALATIAAHIDDNHLTIASLQHQNERLQAQLNFYHANKRKKVKGPDPNELFAEFEHIQEAHDAVVAAQVVKKRKGKAKEVTQEEPDA